MRKPPPLLRPGVLGRAEADPAGDRPRFYASDLILVFILAAALLDIALHLLG